jgi:predicted transposase YbfD/YdcC
MARISRLTWTKDTRSGLWKAHEEVAYYACQIQLNAAAFARAVRSHWGIESAPQAQERKVRDELTDRAQAA